MSKEISRGTKFVETMEVSIKVPGTLLKRGSQIIKAQYRFLEGDLRPFFRNPAVGRVKSEVKDLNKYPEFLKEMVDRGARLLITKNNNWLVVHSEESLEFSNDIQEPQLHEIDILGKNVCITTHFHPFRNNIAQIEYSAKGDPEDWADTHWQSASLNGIMADTDIQKVLGEVGVDIVILALKQYRPSMLTGG